MSLPAAPHLTFEQYLVIDTEQYTVEIHERLEEQWIARTLSGDSTIDLACPRVSISLAALFADAG